MLTHGFCAWLQVPEFNHVALSLLYALANSPLETKFQETPALMALLMSAPTGKAASGWLAGRAWGCKSHARPDCRNQQRNCILGSTFLGGMRTQ